MGFSIKAVETLMEKHGLWGKAYFGLSPSALAALPVSAQRVGNDEFYFFRTHGWMKIQPAHIIN